MASLFIRFSILLQIYYATVVTSLHQQNAKTWKLLESVTFFTEAKFHGNIAVKLKTSRVKLPFLASTDHTDYI